jgi:hypothetical protein
LFVLRSFLIRGMASSIHLVEYPKYHIIVIALELE